MTRKNPYFNRMEKKSNLELEQILSSEAYVDDAKEAALKILESRGVKKSDFRKTKPSKRVEKKIENTKDKVRKSYYENKLFYFGLALILIPSYFVIPTLLTSEKDLVKISGKIDTCSVHYEKVYSTSRYGYKSESIKASLVFDLINQTKYFKLSKNIESRKYHSDYETLRKKLLKSKNVDVWVKNSEINERIPKVFQIDINKKTVISLDSIKNEHNFVFLFTLVLGSSITFLIIRKRIIKKENIFQL